MGEIHNFPGVYRADLEEPTPLENILKSVADAGLQDVAIVGRTLSGEITAWGSQPDADATIGLFMRGASWLANCRVVPDDRPKEEDEKGE